MIDVLMIHGLGSHSGYFKNQMELADDYNLLSFDLLGHGENLITESITLENMAKDQWEQIDELNMLFDENEIEDVVLLGHSLGGLVAQEMYNQQPNRVKSLILANTYSYFVPGISDWAYFNRWYNFNTLSTKDYVKKTIDNCLYDKSNEELRERARKVFHIRRDTYLEACRAGTYANYRKLLPEITVPTLIISSSNDQVTKPFIQDDMHQRIPGSKLITIKRCGHLSNIEKPMEFNAAIRNFLKEVKW